MIADKYELTELPVTEAFARRKRVFGPQGEAVYLSDGPVIRHLAYFELKAGPGLFRGGHVHRTRIENFYCISGRVRVAAVDVQSGEKTVVDFPAGHVLTIRPGLAHRFEALADARLIEFYETAYDPADVVPFADF